ncbi:MAG: hypothetical protein KJN84_17135 [Bacteroidia bacterium]|nr:hypothetical protein [Bacteroidia bacterium]
MSSGKTTFKLEGSIGIKAILIIAVVGIVYQVYLSYYVDPEEVSFADFSYGLSSLAVGIMGLFVAKRYSGSEVFGKTYLALAIGFLLLFVGDLVYNYYVIVLDEDPYPSIADAFFIAFYFFAGYHLIKNIKYFKKDLSKIPILGVISLTLVIMAGFAYMTYDWIEEYPFDFWFGLVYEVGSAGILALAILGVVVFRSSVLGVAWMLLATGIFFYSFADTWYYYLEISETFEITHPVNTLWVVSNTLMVYALYKHKKII